MCSVTPNTSTRLITGVREFSPKPSTGKRPVSFDSWFRGSEHNCRVLNAQPAKEAQLNNARRARIQPGKVLQRIVQIKHIKARADCVVDVPTTRAIIQQPRIILASCGEDSPSSSLVRSTSACMVDQHLPHRLCGDRHEVSAVLCVESGTSNQPYVRLVYESGRLKRVGDAFVGHQRSRHRAKLGIHDFRKALA